MRLNQANYQPGHTYHIYNRGAHRLSIFREPDNYLFVLGKMKHFAQKLAITIIAYCLLPNYQSYSELTKSLGLSCLRRQASILFARLDSRLRGCCP
jgi:hypothetical protein